MADEKKILIVEDEPDMVEWLTAFFEDNGYTTTVAYNGFDGFETGHHLCDRVFFGPVAGKRFNQNFHALLDNPIRRSADFFVRPDFAADPADKSTHHEGQVSVDRQLQRNVCKG